jgi:hypothetical protein
MLRPFRSSLLAMAAALTLTLPSQAQTLIYDSGLYRMMTGGSVPVAVVDLKFYSSPGPAVLATVLNPQGGYRLFYGSVQRGGLNFLYANIREVTQPTSFLQVLDPTTGPVPAYDPFLGPETCQFFLYTGPEYYDFTCFSVDPNHPTSSQGRLEKLPR